MDGEQLDLVYGSGAGDKVRNAKLLVVGAGGVGCELLKNLALCGFVGVKVIDLDIIDVSNLNRQFLFRRRHVSLPKAHVVADQVEAMVPGASIQPTVGNVKDKAFDREFFQSFHVVLNALDNLEARRHVNRMCLTAATPLVESGSTGYNGQCTVISGPDTECYDCSPQLPRKTFAVCTIRSTPDQPIHCIVWAKFLYGLVFGPDDESNVLADLNHEKETHEGDSSDKSPGLRLQKDESAAIFSRRLAARIFDVDIAEQINMKDLWKNRSPPVVQDIAALAGEFGAVHSLNLLEQRVWSTAECAAVLLNVVEKLLTTRESEVGTLCFDKDDDDSLAFVAAASNLRAAAYGVELQSPFAVKGMAGNIIHAIATTNAMVASLIAYETVKIVISEKQDIMRKCKTTFVQKYCSSGRRRCLIQPENLQPPRPECYVCSRGQLVLSVDISKMTLKRVVELVVIGRLGVAEPCIILTVGDAHNIIFETGAGLEPDEVEIYDANLERTLEDLQFAHGAVLDVEDFSQDFKCTVTVEHTSDFEDPESVEGFRLSGISQSAKPGGSGLNKRKRATENGSGGEASKSDGKDDEGALVLVEDRPDDPPKKARFLGDEPAISVD